MSKPRGERSAVGAGGPEAWSSERAERHLLSLELFGMRFGLDRMHRMMTVLGSPQQRFRSIHVVGTNGKSSTTRMTAAILERHGLRTGVYLSPHLVSYTERVRIGERDISTHAFAAAIARAAWAAERVNRTLAEDDHVTQFELLTAAAFWELAEQEVDVAVVEAGLGGRYDATSVVESSITVLTNVGLEHTRWLGPTVADIAAEKLAVLRPETTLVLGAKLDPEVLALAEAIARERSARLLQVGEGGAAGSVEGYVAGKGEHMRRGNGTHESEDATPVLLARGEFQRRNFALARTVAAAYLTGLGIEMREDAVTTAAAHTAVPGRLEVLCEHPLTLLDGAHNTAAVAALLESLPELLAGRPLGLVLGVLEDKDAAGMLAALLPHCTRVWFTAPPSARALPPATLESLARQLGFEDVSCEPQPRRALEAAQRWAREPRDDAEAAAGPGGSRSDGAPAEAVVLAAGSIYLVGDLLAHDLQGTHEAREGRAEG